MSDDPFQKSVRLLDDIVGSPSYYQSPRHRRPQSSLFTSTMVPLRRSDVRDFALNNSISMNTSELENFMLDPTTTAQPAETHVPTLTPVVKDASDNLYQAFLESLQAHSSPQEVFDTIAEFTQNCNNTMEVMRDTRTEKDVEWLEFERNSWRLVQALYQNRLLAESEAMEEDEVAESVPVHPPSEKEIAIKFYKTNSKIDEYQRVVDWLHTNAADRVGARHGPKMHHYMDSTIAWENTLHQLQNNSVAYRSSRAIVSTLDPDAPLRQSKPLHDLDMEDEARLMQQVWTEVRCNRLTEAQQVCHHCGQPWRAATLDGWRLHHDPNYAARVPSTEKLPVEGNPHRDIWKLCAWRLSEDTRAGKYARAIYGALCGNLRALLPVCDSWEDVLWAHTRVLIDQLVEQQIRDNSLREYTPLPDAYWNTRVSMEDTFATLDSNGDSRIRDEGKVKERVIQKLLILDQLPQLMDEMLSWARQPKYPPQLIRFLAHLVLTLRMLGQPISQEIGNEIIKIYVKVVMEQKDPQLVAYYTATLPPDEQVTLYAQFLQNIDQSQLRKEALDVAETVHLPVQAITQRVVENIRNEQSQERSAALELSAEITEEDRRKISALEWVVLYPSQRAEALWQTNALIRTFLALGKIQAARLAFNQVPPDSISKVLVQYQVEEDYASDYSDCLPTKVSAAIQEHLSHKAYLDAEEGFADWFEHFYHARPKEPAKPGVHATFPEKVAHDHRLASYNKELDRWRASMDHQTKCVKQQLYNVLLFPDGGWLAASDHEDRLRAQQLESLRTLCIPKIVLLLHTVLHYMACYKEAVQLADLIVDERYHIFKVYSKQQMGELLSKIRESSLASLAEKKDPWGHIVST